MEWDRLYDCSVFAERLVCVPSPIPCVLLLQRHPWFKGLEWDRLYEMEAAFVPEVKDELDTQNFEKFEEVGQLLLFLLLVCWLLD